jgi:hypothetical protein
VYLGRTRLDCSVVFLMVHMYLRTVEEVSFTVLGYCSATEVTDNHSLLYVFIDTVSPVREQFFRLDLTSIRRK